MNMMLEAHVHSLSKNVAFTFELLDVEADRRNDLSLPLFLRLEVIEESRFPGIVEADDQHVALFLLQSQHVRQLVEQTHGCL